MKLSIVLDDELHAKVKVYAALNKTTLNALAVELFKKTIDDYEKENGKIKFAK